MFKSFFAVVVRVVWLTWMWQCLLWWWWWSFNMGYLISSNLLYFKLNRFLREKILPCLCIFFTLLIIEIVYIIFYTFNLFSLLFIASVMAHCLRQFWLIHFFHFTLSKLLKCISCMHLPKSVYLYCFSSRSIFLLKCIFKKN